MSQPVNLRLTSLKFPLPAIASICHRISGVLLLFGVGYFTWLLNIALSNEDGFSWVVSESSSWFHGTLIWLTLVAVCYHLFAGIRHLLMDLHVGETLVASRRSALLVFALTAISALFLGYWLIAS